MFTQKMRMEKYPVHIIVNLLILGSIENTHSIKNKASGVQLNQEVVVLAQKIRSKCNGLMGKFHRSSTHLLLLANLGKTYSL